MAMKPTGPMSAQVLGVLSSVPFAVLAGIYCWGPEGSAAPAAMALSVYAAAIASFMGGSRWGLEAGRPAPRWLVLAPGMILPLAALLVWIATVDRPLSWRLGGFMVCFIGIWLWDTIFSELPGWYSRLRTIGQLTATASLAIALEKSLRL
jgi:hypothetical protein